MKTAFNDLVKNTALALSLEGVDEAEVASKLVAKLGPEDAYLIFHAAKTYLRLPVVEVPPDSDDFFD